MGPARGLGRVARAVMAMSALAAVAALLLPAVAAAAESPAVVSAVQASVAGLTAFLEGPFDPGPLLLLLVAGGLGTLGVLSGPAVTEAPRSR